MSHEDAVQALQAAAVADEQASDPFAQTPSGDTEKPAPVQPQGEAAGQEPPAPQPEPPAPDTFDDGSFNPDTLAPELQAGWKQLQAAYTRKTQELAAQRQQFEAFGDPEVVEQAVDLFTRIQDPLSWPQLHQELTEAMVQYGLSPAEAQQAASEAIQEAAAPAANAPDFAALESDPELAPLAQHLQSLQSRLDSFEQRAAQEREVMEAEQLHAAMVGELTRQETAIRQARPDYTDGDLDAIYQLSSFHNGNLIAAQHAYEDFLGARMQRYFDSKQSAAQDQSVQPPAGAEVLSETPKEAETLEEATEWAIEHLRNLQAQGEDLGI
jgi:hypothetical protein